MSKKEKKEVILGIKENLNAEFRLLDTNHDGLLDASEQAADGSKKVLRRGNANSERKLSVTDYLTLKYPHFADDHDSYIKFLTEDILDQYDRNANFGLEYSEYDEWKEEDRAKLHIYSKKVRGALVAQFALINLRARLTMTLVRW
jgi:hypothetical protein